jgi:2-polyprenyl-6-methoxyphenol hydroxylase-like FAD-dependent oxidoreductase
VVDAASPIRTADVLIVGAGPTGLVLALGLARRGVRVRVIDKTAQAGTTSRALAVQARTLEFYRQLDLADAVVARGRKASAVNLWVAGKQVAHAVFGDLGAGLSPYPYVLTFAQDEHERLLIDHLAQSGVDVERCTELIDFEDRPDSVHARLKLPDGSLQTCEEAYLGGCDGARSTVREKLRIGFPGGTYAHLFYVADVEGRGATMNGEIQVALDTTDFLAVFPLKDERRARLVGTIRQQAEGQHEKLSWDDISKRVIGWMRLEVERVNWFSTYQVHHRVANRFRQGRVFLLGDAAHIHSPVGGQGMNTGIGDAVNLAWKLGAILQRRAKVSLLDSYDPERGAFARRLVATTDRAFTGVTSAGPLARLLRLQVVPAIMPRLFAWARVRRFLFRTVSQTAVNYRGSSLSEGGAGGVHGGDRLPWVKLDLNGEDNFAPLSSLEWQLHVYGVASSELRAMCAARKLPLEVFRWRADMSGAGLQRNAAYLVRPDGYVALADGDARAATVRSYLDARALSPAL